VDVNASLAVGLKACSTCPCHLSGSQILIKDTILGKPSSKRNFCLYGSWAIQCNHV